MSEKYRIKMEVDHDPITIKVTVEDDSPLRKVDALVIIAAVVQTLSSDYRLKSVDVKEQVPQIHLDILNVEGVYDVNPLASEIITSLDILEQHLKKVRSE